VARFNADGSLDATFNPNGPIPDYVFTLVDTDAYEPNISVTNVVLQADGKIVVGVTAPLPVTSESQSEAVARLSGGGGGTVAPDDVLSLAGEPDGERLLVSGRASDE
jgi:hypothetical protein